MNPSNTPMDEAVAAIFSGTTSLIVIAFYVVFAIAAWKMFSKAGYPGILAFIPIVNVILVVKIAGYSAWMSLLYLIPIVGFIFAIFVALRLGANFGKGGGFSVFLLWMFPIIGYFIIGLGDARYQPRAH
ncbi:DUF5684 domain-containing protein [Leucobacter aridicollis]|uniref:Signal peptidase I n=1 Tax=Leucobacter aridicollis TaxID=283878 RepID=A0A852R2K9_9MICO|nr:DUF5684 domain-containing protein [Leucobacter aridicollis]MBL3682063.1 hypothetical protein [Leucobacter aridicollis]NYD26887.1 hypothetical protein [Leucobacter aridicollis]